ncbi:hypothetical protein DRI96_06670 [Candidatus Aerophobetes bacterium]|uniref:Uncharacterized protein n=2 Tax=Aerophobetes bacterium TaxID=2030807 RepID=A0A662D6U7_UNCAE|nr:MAG: hypothetical protein DRI96_06670 [Candidatus Aerophobetes bacterium]
MKIVIDGFEDLVIAEEDETLRQLLVQLDKWIRENNRIIVQIKLEGRSLSELDEKVVFDRKVGEFKTLELFTANLWQWAIDSLEEIKVYLPEIAKKMEQVSLLIQQGDSKKAFSLLDRYIGLWERVNQILRTIEKIFALDYNKIFLKKNGDSYNMEELVQLLEEAKRAIGDNDFLALADILEYELAPRIREKKKLVEEIINTLKHQMN